MELKRKFLIFIMFLFFFKIYPQELNNSIYSLAKGYEDIEVLCTELKDVLQIAKNKKIYIDDNFELNDYECSEYRAKTDEVLRQNLLYRKIYFKELKTGNDIIINFFKTDKINTKIQIWFNNFETKKTKLIEGSYDKNKDIYIFKNFFDFSK